MDLGVPTFVPLWIRLGGGTIAVAGRFSATNNASAAPLLVQLSQHTHGHALKSIRQVVHASSPTRCTLVASFTVLMMAASAPSQLYSRAPMRPRQWLCRRWLSRPRGTT